MMFNALSILRLNILYGIYLRCQTPLPDCILQMHGPSTVAHRVWVPTKYLFNETVESHLHVTVLSYRDQE